MSKNTRLSIVAALSLAAAPRVTAQSSVRVGTAADSVRASELPTLELHAPSTYGGWLAAARHSAFRTRTGVPGYRDFYEASVRLGWSIGDQSRTVSGTYFIDVIPAALSTDMPEYRWTSRCQPETYCPGATPIPHNVYAFGITPLGFALNFGGGPARLTIEASGGGLLFSRRIPDPVAARFNFTASAGPTLELRLTPSGSMRVGYLWHHTSNGGTGKVNPGLNSGILALGMMWHRSPRRD
jgi:lipid A 3-O-deacylase PagL